MFTYETKQSWWLERVWVHHKGSMHSGRGKLDWDPKSGFHLIVWFDKSPGVTEKVEIRQYETFDRSASSAVRMRIGLGRYARSNPLLLSNDIEFLECGQLDLPLKRVVFSTPFRQGSRSVTALGSALFEIGTGLRFPDVVKRPVYLVNKCVQNKSSGDGIAYKDDWIELSAWRLSDTQLRAFWTLNENAYSKHDSWRLAESMRFALSVLGGRRVSLIEREVDKVPRTFTERRLASEVVKLGELAIAPRQTTLAHHVDKDKFIRLTKFHLAGGTNAYICQRIQTEMENAACQDTLTAKELLSATTMAGALQTFSGRSHKKKDKIERLIESFRSQYLDDKWTDWCKEIVESYTRIRHRTAHPYWLSDDPEDSLVDRMRIAQFCGYMVYAIAGIPDLAPRFPAPYETWPPLMTITPPKQSV